MTKGGEYTSLPQHVEAILEQADAQRRYYEDAAFHAEAERRGFRVGVPPVNPMQGRGIDQKAQDLLIRITADKRYRSAGTSEAEVETSGPQLGNGQNSPARSRKNSDHISATPYRWKDPSEIPKRQWIYDRSLIRKFVTVTVAPGGVGKSSLTMVEALALVTGRALLGKTVEKPSRVWLWNLEDPMDELERRIQAACEFYDISSDDIGGRLFVDSGRDRGLCTAITVRNKTIIQRPVIDQMTAELQRRAIDVFIVDPFVSSHSVPENDNPAMDAVAKEWGRVADAANASVHLVHHTRKLGSDAEVTAESSRGGKALTDAAREVRAINRMSVDEAAKFGVRNHRNYFRMYSDKANMAPPSEISDWYEIKSVELPNGDNIGVVASWTPPDAFDDVSASDLLNVQRRIHTGEWREDIRSPAWAGKAIAEALGLDIELASAKQKIKILLKTWIENGALRLDTVIDEARRERRVVRVGAWSE